MSIIKEILLSMGEEKYKDFICKFIPTIEKKNVIGVRTPLIRKLAKSLENYESFLNELPHTYYEENNLHAFLIEREKNFNKCIEKLNAFLPFVDNWATCDGMKPKVLKKDPKKLLMHIKEWIRSENVYAVRYGINLLMSFFLDEHFKEEYHSLVANIKSEEYYINMMRAWYFATALSKKYNETLPYIEKKVLDPWTHNKAIQKATESLRITKEQKVYLKTLK